MPNEAVPSWRTDYRPVMDNEKLKFIKSIQRTAPRLPALISDAITS